MGDKSDKNENFRASYNAIVNYHNNLVQIRFTVAGLVLAANGFLAIGFFQETYQVWPQMLIPFLGIMLVFVFWLMEIRTHCLLENLGERGKKLEKKLKIENNLRFFSLMQNQPIGARFLIFQFIKVHPNKFTKYFFSHSFGIGLLYFLLCIFWKIILIKHFSTYLFIF